MHKTDRRAGLTLVEVMIAVVLVGVAATIVYTEMILAYRILMRSRARLEAQSIAFDRLWEIYHTPTSDMPMVSQRLWDEPTPEWSSASTNGTISCHVLADLPSPVGYWQIIVTVWPPTNSPLQMGTNPLARAAVWRYRGER